MSATGRGPRLGGGLDDYQTPSWCVRRLLEAVPLPGGLWLEPACGDGAVARAVSAWRGDVTWAALDISADAVARFDSGAGESYSTVADFLAPGSVPVADYAVVVTNPPYAVAEAFVERAFAVAPKAHVAMLLRVNFLASEERNHLMRAWPPDVHVIPNRPSFKNRKTDSTEYAWFVWPPSRRRAHGRLTVLGLTPLAERRAG